jgi:hypothetical protein
VAEANEGLSEGLSGIPHGAGDLTAVADPPLAQAAEALEVVAGVVELTIRARAS